MEKYNALTRRVAAGMLLAAALAGCSTPALNYQPQTTRISEPPLGSTNEKQVGEELLKQGKYSEHDALNVLTIVKPHWAYTVHPGYFLKSGENKDGVFYRIGGPQSNAGFIDKSTIADPYSALLVRPDGTLCVVTILNVSACGNGVKSGFEMTRYPAVTADSVQRTLIYNGRIGNKINIGYREFLGNFASLSLNNNVEYDLDESPVIGYKGARLQIIQATNRSIRYKVISNFNEAER